MQVATQAIAHMPTLLLFPLVPFVLEVALVFWWVFVAAYLYSSGMRIWSHPYLSPYIPSVQQGIQRMRAAAAIIGFLELLQQPAAIGTCPARPVL